MNQLRQTGLTCILVEMPFHLAIFDVNAAEDVMAQFPDIQHWYIAGHSMGGAMASQFASEYPDEVDGLLLLGAYLYGDYPPADTLTVYGSLNQSVEDKIDYTENVVEIEGGNHAQFATGQKGDLPATISAEEQQAQTVGYLVLCPARSESGSFKKCNFMSISPWATSLTLIVYTRRKI
ncbi:MAG: alpha/beta fold hydrolase [Flavonifractor plautii]